MTNNDMRNDGVMVRHAKHNAKVRNINIIIITRCAEYRASKIIIICFTNKFSRPLIIIRISDIINLYLLGC